MGYFPGLQTATPKTPKVVTPPTPIKTSAALTDEENAARQAANIAAGVGDQYGRSPSDPNYGTAPKVSSDQFRTGGGATISLGTIKEPPISEKERVLVRNLMISNLAMQQQASREGRSYATQAWADVSLSPYRREELTTRTVPGEYDTYLVSGGKVLNTGIMSVQASTSKETGRELPFLDMITPLSKVDRGKLVTIGSEGRSAGKLRPALSPLALYGRAEKALSPYAKKLTTLFIDKPFLEKQYKEQVGIYSRTGKTDLKGKLVFARYGFVQDIEEKPLKNILLFSASAIIPPSISGGKYFLTKYGLENNLVVRGVGSVVKYGAPGLYAGFTATEIATQKDAISRWQTVGAKAGELGLMYGGGLVGVKLSTPIEYQTALVKQVRTLPVEKQTRFWELYKEAKIVEKTGIPPKSFDLSGFERIPPKARPIVKSFLVKRDVVVYGSAGQRPFLYGKSAIRSYATSDIDVASLVRGGSSRDAAALAKQFTFGGVKRVSVVPRTGKVTIGGQKAIEFHEYEKIYGNIRSVTPFYKPASSQFIKTPDGITVLKPGVQVRRKLVGAYLDVGRFSKDMPDFRRVLGSAYYVAEQEAGQSIFLQRERFKQLELFKGQKGSFSLFTGPVGKKISTPSEELPEVLPRPRYNPKALLQYSDYGEYKIPEKGYSSYSVFPTRKSRYPVIGGSYSNGKPYSNGYPSPIVKNETFKYPVYIPKTLGLKISVTYPTPRIKTPGGRVGYRGGGTGGPSYSTITKNTNTNPIQNYNYTKPNKKIISIKRPVGFDLDLLGSVKRKSKGQRRRPFKYQASIKAVIGGIKQKGKTNFLTGYEVRGIPGG